jgi:hypothetical protein
VGGVLLVALLLVDSAGMVAWWQVAVLFPFGAAPLVLRSLVDLFRDYRAMMDVHKDTPGE